jgi:DNA-binding NtrC family response regulator
VAVLYLIAAGAAAPGHWGLAAWGTALVALALSAATLLPLRHTDAVGAARVGWLGLSVAFALVTTVLPGVGVLIAFEVVRIAAFPLVGFLLVDLALTVPEPDRVPTSPRVRLIAVAVSVFGSVLALIEAALPLHVGGMTLLLPSSAARAPEVAAALCVLLALVIRWARARAGGRPDALAENAWAALGLVPAAVVAVLTVLSLVLPPVEWFGASRLWFSSALSLAAIVLVRSHILLIDPRYRLAVGGALRRSLAVTFALVAVSGVTILLRDRLPAEPLELSLWVTAGVFAALALFALFTRLLRDWLAPAGGALLTALELATGRLADVASLSDVGAAILPALRAASLSTDGFALFYAFDPAVEVSIDAAGQPRLSHALPPDALFEQVHRQPHDVIVRRPLEDAMVRRPEVRPLVDALARLDALCVIPLRNQSELEGMLVLPRGHRTASLSFEELSALDRFSALLAAFVSVISREARATQRLNEVIVARDQASQQNNVLERDAERLQRHERALALGRLAHDVSAPIAYSPKSRALCERLSQLASADVPVLLHTPQGTDLEPWIRWFHRHTDRSEQALVVADCAGMPPEQQRIALFGSDLGGDQRPGFLRLAQDGTLVLIDAPALSVALQGELEQVIARKRMRPLASDADVGVNVRFLVTSRVALSQLIATQRVDVALAARLGPVTLTVPPLRDRREDLQSLVLLAIDRLARVHGRAELGIEADAMQALLDQRLDGNDLELTAILDRAAVRCDGPRITLAHLRLPRAGASVASVQNPLSGSFDTVEKRVLKYALAQADGNKSEAARLLGLKRTTFLDKLRRHDLDDGAPSRAES